MSKFLNNINLEAGNDIQFKTTAGANAGKIEQDGDDLVLSNAVGDVLLGDGSSDVYIGDGTSNVDILFEQSGSIRGDGSAITLTIGGANTTLNLENPNINGTLSLGATSINNKFTFTSSSGYILFDYEPTTAAGEYTTEVPLLKVDRSGSELTVLSRLTNNGAIALGNDDTVAIVAGDTKGAIKDNLNYASENIILASEAGFHAYGFPSNDTTWTNRNEFRFRSDSATASDNGLYIGDGTNVQFIDLSRNLKNIGTINSGAITSTGSVTATSVGVTNIVTNRIVKFNGSILDDSVMYDDGTNIGIGTTSPSSLLHINAADGVMVDTYTAYIRNQEATAGDNFGLGIQAGSNSSDVSLQVSDKAGTSLLRVRGDGNVGIGTTSPAQKLHVNGNVDIDNGGILLQQAYGVNFGISGYDIVMPTTTRLDIKTAGTERVSISNTGNVGIGTTSPEVKLHVGASTLGTAPDTDADIISSGGITIDDNRRLSFDTNYYVHGNIRYATDGTSEAKLEYQGYYGHNFITRSSSKMVIKGDTGYVGIGVTIPRTKLHVTGLTGDDDPSLGSSTAPLLVSNSANSYGLNVGVNSAGGAWLQAQSNVSSIAYEILLNPLGGNVGIGTTDPNYLLQVGNTTQQNSNVFSGVCSGDFIFNLSKATTNLFSIRNNATAVVHLNTQNSARLALGVSTGSATGTITEHLTINSSGDVGIGDTTPSYKLDVNGTLRTTGQAYFNSNVTITGSATMAGGTMTGNLEINTDRAVYNASYFGTSTASTRSKIRFYGTDATYAIGMQNNCTYGGLGNTWAMTFQFSNANNRGFWWGDSSHSQAQGAMALTTDGNLTVASRIRVGYGESDTTTPATYALDATGEVAVTSGDVELTTASKGIILKSPNGTRYRVTINDSGELITASV